MELVVGRGNRITLANVSKNIFRGFENRMKLKDFDPAR